MFASAKGYDKIVYVLLQSGANPNMRTCSRGVNALMFATEPNHVEVVKLLLEAKADPNMVDMDGNSVLTIASVNGQADTVRLLLSYNADYTHTVIYQGCPFDVFACACISNSLETVQILQAKVSPHSLSFGWYVACLYNSTQLLNYLLHGLPEVSSKNRELADAVANGDLSCVKLDIHRLNNFKFFHGITLLMIACSCGHVDVVNYLLKHGVAIAAKDDFGRTAVDYCKQNSSIIPILGVSQQDSEMMKQTFNKEDFRNNFLYNSSKVFPTEFETAYSYYLFIETSKK